MAGFLDTMGLGGLRKRMVAMSRMGNEYDDLLIKNSQAIGFIEGELRKRNGLGVTGDDLLKYSMAISDTTSALRTKTLAFFQLDYATKREKLRDIASNAEIEFVLDTITDDAIVYQDDNRFCAPNDIRGKLRTQKAVTVLKELTNYEDKVVEKYHERFDDIYSAWGFDNGVSAWQYFFQWLIEGHLAFEIIYDNVERPKNIVGFKELDPATLFPVVQKDERGKVYLEWLQKDDINKIHRQLADSQIIYISYSNHFRTKRVSFVERMIRSFNLLRIIEHSKVIWHIMNAPIRLKTSVPIGTKAIQKAKEDMREFLNTFKEDIFFSNDTGELLVEGKPKMIFYKNYVVPVNDRGEKIDIETIEHAGPDLQDNQLLAYFLKKLKLDSKLPFSRWDYNEGGGSYLLGPDTVNREEIAYGKFIRRLRTGYKELMDKPLYIQMCLDMEQLKNDKKFKNLCGVKFLDDNLFERLKEAELIKKNAETITTLLGLKADPTSKFNIDFLVKRYLNINEEDLDANEAEIKKAKAMGEAGAQGGGEAGAQGGAGGGEEAGAGPLPAEEAAPEEEAGAQEAAPEE